MPFVIEKTALEGVMIVETGSFQDERGSFARLFCQEELAEVLGDRKVAQINQSITTHLGTVRGMHYQNPPHAEMKIVRCLQGRVFDVAVDIRRDSPTFLQWVGVELTAENRRALVVPEGFAHGFQALEDDSALMYVVTAPYAVAAEGGLHYADPRVGIVWPLPVSHVSEKDARHPWIQEEA